MISDANTVAISSVVVAPLIAATIAAAAARTKAKMIDPAVPTESRVDANATKASVGAGGGATASAGAMDAAQASAIHSS